MKKNAKTQKPDGVFEIKSLKHVPKTKIEALIDAQVYDDKHGYYKAQDFSVVKFLNKEEEYYKKMVSQTVKKGNFDPIINALNRSLNRSFIRKIKNAFLAAKDSTLTTIVLAYTNIFNKKGEFELVVIDGQHRIMAFHELLELYRNKLAQYESNNEKYEYPGNFDFALVFKVVQVSTIDEFVKLVVTLNSVSHNFKEANYIQTYSALGVPAYRDMEKLRIELEQEILPKYGMKNEFPIEFLKQISSLTKSTAIRTGKADFNYDEARQNVIMLLQVMKELNINSVRPGRQTIVLIKSEGYQKNHNGFIKYLNLMPENTKKRIFKGDEKELKHNLQFHYKNYLHGKQIGKQIIVSNKSKSPSLTA